MKGKWIFTIAAVMLSISMVLSACGSSSPNTNNQAKNDSTDAKPAASEQPAGDANKAEPQKEFKFGLTGLYKPFNFQENGKLTGFDVEIGYALAEKMGMKAVPVTNPWETLIQALLEKKFDAILGSMTITQKRLEVVNFTIPYYRSGAQIFVAGDNDVIDSGKKLKDKKIGVLKASTYKNVALEFTDEKNIVQYDSDLTALMDLPTHRVDAVITDQMVGFRVIKENAVNIKSVGDPLTFDEQGIAVRKDESQLLEQLNKALEEIVKDGTYDKISEKWFGRSILGRPTAQ